ncbi:MAG: carbohydrate binding domain-containing protein [Ignavibacteria bacterium]|jgi:hypothetical protein
MKKKKLLFLLIITTSVFLLSLTESKAQTNVLDNFESYENTDSLANHWRIFGYASQDFQLVTDTTDKVAPGGDNYLQYTYNATTSTWGGVVERIQTDETFYPLDLSSAQAGLQFYLKGDGTDNVLRFRYYNFFDGTGTEDARWRSQPISLKDTTWHIVRIPFVLDTTETYGLHLWYTTDAALAETEEEMLESLSKITRFQINLEYPDVSDTSTHKIYLDDFRAMDFLAPQEDGDIKIADFEDYINSTDFKTEWQGFGYGTLDYELGRDNSAPEGYKYARWTIQPEERTTWGMAFRNRSALYSIPDLSSISDDGGVQFLLKGDGSEDNFLIRFTDTDNNYWGSYWISLEDTSWQQITIPFIVDSLKGFRWLGNDPNGTYWTSDIGTQEMFRSSLGKITEVRFGKRNPVHDDIKRVISLDAIYAINILPPLDPESADDFETYTDSDDLTASWNQFGAGSVSLELSETEFASGAKSMSITYDGSLGYTAVRKRNIIPGLDFSELSAGMQYYLKGDGTNNEITLRLMSGDEMWESAPVSLNTTEWQHIGVQFTADSVNGFRYLGSNTDNPVWSTDVGTDEQLYGDLANIDQLRFYIRNPEAISENKTVYIDNIEGVDEFDGGIVVSVEDQYGSSLPFEYNLTQNYPNPFNPSTKIEYSLQKPGIVTLKIYNILGQEVLSLVNEFKNAGNYKVDFNAGNLASGVYIYQLRAGSFINSKKMLLLK